MFESAEMLAFVTVETTGSTDNADAVNGPVEYATASSDVTVGSTANALAVPGSAAAFTCFTVVIVGSNASAVAVATVCE